MKWANLSHRRENSIPHWSDVFYRSDNNERGYVAGNAKMANCYLFGDEVY